MEKWPWDRPRWMGGQIWRDGFHPSLWPWKSPVFATSFRIPRRHAHGAATTEGLPSGWPYHWVASRDMTAS